MGRCYPIEFKDFKEVYIDISKCPVVKAGFLCSNYKYYGDKFGDIDGKRLIPTTAKNQSTDR
jgi:hypothetical protein